ncbi:MAG: hypothetical protein ABEJ40_07445 [Haloarculaceae archaeon]
MTDDAATAAGEASADSRAFLTLPADTYRQVDRATKLAGVVLVAAGLEVGPATATGLALACCGTVLATATVFVHT